MGQFNDNIIEDIRQRTDIVNIIGEFLPLKKRGRNFLANCPFHNEKTPSFTVSPEKQIYHCFGCNASGNVFTFLMEHQGMTFPEALKYLGDKVGVEVKPSNSYTPSKKDDLHEQKKERLINIHTFVARYFYKKLHDEYGKEAWAYAKNKRGLSQETLEKFKIGYAPFRSEELIGQLEKLGYTEEELLSSGIFSKSMEGKLFSKFFNRLIFPIENVKNQIVGFGGRNLGNGEPKYLNSPETDIFHKKYNLYGLNVARDEIRKKNQVLVMEGYMDVISVWQKGVGNAVASLGTAFTEEQGRLLERYANELVLVYDNDNAGRAAALRALEILRPLKIAVKVAEYQEAKDPDEYIVKKGLNAFLERIRNAKSSFRYLLDLSKSNFDYSRPEDKVKCIRSVLPEVMSVEDPLLRNEYLNVLSDELNVRKEELEAIVFGKPNLSGPSSSGVKPLRGEKEIDVTQAEDKAQLDVLGILINQLDFAGYLEKGEWLRYFNNHLIHRTISSILSYPAEKRTVEHLTSDMEDTKAKELVAHLAIKDNRPEMSVEDFEKYLKQVRRIFLKDRIAETIGLINIAEKEGNKSRSVELQNEWNRLKTELNQI